MSMFDIATALQNLKANPMAFLLARRFNVPQDIINDPNKIAQYLLDTGQITQSQYDAARQESMLIQRRNMNNR